MNRIKHYIIAHIAILVAALALFPGTHHRTAHAATTNAPANIICANGVIFTRDINWVGKGEPLSICPPKGQGFKYATMPEGWNDQISSFRTSTRILIYEHSGFKGKCVGIRANESWGDLTQIEMRKGTSWNDQISSVVVNPSNLEWTKCR